MDNRILSTSDTSERYMLLEVESPAIQIEREDRLPLNLAIVLDASGSMGGGRLRAAKVAVHQLIDALDENDTLSLISFAEGVIAHALPVRLETDGRRTLHLAVDQVRTRGSTNLFAGWYNGARVAAEAMEREGRMRNRVLLLSDGMANRGVRSLRVIKEHAEAVCLRGLLTSTIGIGAGYSPRYLQALALAGGGSMHDTDTGEDLIDVLLGELDDARQAVAENAEIQVVLPTGVEATVLSTGDEHAVGGTLRIRLGTLFERSVRRVAVRLCTPVGQRGETLKLSARLLWNEPGCAQQQHASEVVSETLSYATESALPPEITDLNVASVVARLWNAWAIRSATTLNEQRDFEAAAEFLDLEMTRFECYVRDLPHGKRFLRELRSLRSRIQRRLDPAVLKGLATGSYKELHGKADMRRDVGPDDWKFDLIGDDDRS